MNHITTDITPEAKAAALQSIAIGGEALLNKGFELVFAMGVQSGFQQAMEGLDALKVKP